MEDQEADIKFAASMVGTVWRVARIAIGATLVVVGVVAGRTVGVIVALIGVAPVGSGMSNRCTVSKAIGAPWKGEDAADLVRS